METLNVMEEMRPLPFIVMFVVAAEFDILKESLEGTVVVDNTKTDPYMCSDKVMWLQCHMLFLSVQHSKLGIL